MIESRIVADAEALAQEGASLVEAALSAAGEKPAVCLAGGSTPGRLYERVAARGDAIARGWERVNWFVGDERLVPPDHADSNLAAIRRHLLDPLGADPGTIHPVPTVGLSEDEAAADYARVLQAFYGGDALDPARPLFDVVLLGLGEDGHTASLFPGSPQLDECRLWAAAVARSALPPFHPRVTLTFPVLASSRLTLVLAAGAGKRPAMTAIRDGEDLPAARIRGRGRVIWLVDAAAAPER